MTDLLDESDAAGWRSIDVLSADPATDLTLDTAEPEPPSPRYTDDDWNWLQRWFSILVVGGLMLYTFIQLHPSQILANTTPSGGDLGAHVWGPAYLRDHILPHGRLSGWAPDWYAGFPMYHFYMVVPALIVLLFDLILPYGIALKLVTVLGIVTLPFFAWLFGRATRIPRPAPEMFAAAAVWFLFDDTFRIYGGNIASTMAGEFSFSISLSFAFAFFAVFAHSIQTGKNRALAAALCALASLSHGLVMFFVAIGGLMIFLLYPGVKRLWLTLWVGLTGIGLSAFWLIPFVARQGYGTDMFYEKRPVGKTPDDKRTDSYWEMFFPQSTLADRFIMVAAIVGFVVAVQRRQRGAVWLGLVGSTFGVWAYLWPQSLLWNARLLPFMYLCRYMLAAYGIYVLVAYLVGAIRPTFSTDGRRIAMLGVGTLTAIVTIGWQSFHLWDLPGGAQRYDDAKKRWVYEFPDWPGPKFTGNDNAKGFVTQWASWDFEGYEKKKAYGEYHDIVATMKSIGEERGCGRAVWENNNDQDKYGTPMALMLLPFWTDGCIGSMEGLFFEAAGTTPFHFMTASAVSDHSSNPVRRLQYEDRQLNRGVEFMKTLGVRYYLAYNDAVTEQADKHEGLTLLRQSGPWKVYELVDSTLVVPLKTQPIVVPGVGTDRDKWLEVGMSWFQHQADWDAVPVAGGPPQWQRVGVRVTSDKPTTDSNLAVVFPDNAIERTELAPVAVSNVRTGDNFISFDVDKIGVPVMVKVSAFPNWKASGATGPWRAAPNFMVVVPTSTTVRLNYGFTGVDLGSHAITFAALGSLIVLWRRRPPDLPVLVGEGDVEPLSDADEADEEFVEVGQPVADGESARVHVESGWLPPPPTPSEGYDR